MRNMSFMLTTRQVQARTKTVTRRVGWWWLKAGDIVRAVEKCQGLKKGEKIVPLATIRIVSAVPEPLTAILARKDRDAEMAREGFDGFDPHWFVEMFAKTHHVNHSDGVNINRIEFEYVET